LTSGDAGRGTYLDGKVSRDSSTGEESPSVGLQEKSSEIIPFEGFCRKRNGCSKLLERLKNGWELSRR
jgi:hypothetical protein